MKSLDYLLFLVFLFCFSIQVFAQQEENLLLHYELNNDFTDNSPNGYDGAGVNGVFVEDYAGNPESALSANGVDTYVEFPEASMLKPELPITIALRAKFDVMDQTQVLFTTDFSELHHSGVWLQVATENRLAAAFGNGVNGFNGSGRRGFFTDNAFDTDTWYSIVVVYTGPNDIRIYVDCELQEGFYTGSANDIGYTDAPGSLGRKRANPESIAPPYYFEGDLDDFRMWDIELTEEQILGLCVDSPFDCPEFGADIGDPCAIDGELGVLNDFCECILESDTTQTLQCDIAVPNVFTPNGDGMNDYLIPEIECELSDYEMLIFNRWGNRVFHTTDPFVGWSGRNSKQQISPGVYFYTIRYSPKSATSVAMSGTITLLE